ncbi:MAG: Abortive infection protein [Pseudonocardia sp.]|nr:Abortive infection protein [Pseudonocardia sp.]
MATLTAPRTRVHLHPARLRLGLILAIAILAGSNLVSNRVLTGLAYVPWNLAVAALLVFVARRCGLSWADLGLQNRRLRRGVLIGAVAASLVVMIYAIGWAVPATRTAFADQRAAGSVQTLLFAALIQIPLGTVLLEEVAFRGVLPALFGGQFGGQRFWPTALASSALFGLWHVLPSFGVTAANAAMGATIGGIGLLAQTVLVVLGMTGAGMLLMVYRRWGGHLVTPVIAHIATNSLGVLIAWLVITHT